MRTEPVYGDARSKVSTWTSLHEMKAKGKRQSGKSTDFPKRKNKLGKGKRPPENATKISFKSGSIVLPSQLVQSSSQQPTGKRKLGLEVREGKRFLNLSVSWYLSFRLSCVI